jgi:adenine-specific DNA-methyltransferase
VSIAIQIVDGLRKFDNVPLPFASLSLWRTLGYESDRLNEGVSPSDPQGFWNWINREGVLSEQNALLSHWQSAHLLFQLTNEDIKLGFTRQGSLMGEEGGYDKGQIDSFLFLAIELKDKSYSRTELSKITREVNRAFRMPVIVLFKHGPTISISVIDRRTNKRDGSKDVVDGRLIAIIKDVALFNPHTAHVKILSDLSFEGLDAKKKPDAFRDLYEA